MKLNYGYSNIKVKLLNFNFEDIAKRVYDFGRFGNDGYKPLPEKYSKNNDRCSKFIDEVIYGKTFPKFMLSGIRIEFEVKGISRICLAQLTRDNAIFCSESHGLRPLSQELNIPMNIANDDEIMHYLVAAQSLLEKAYITACKKEIPYPDARYLGLHAQTISLTCSFTPSDFVRSCYSRTNNSFCDELNYVYRNMYYELSKAIDAVKDNNSKSLLQWVFPKSKCIDDNFYTRTKVFNGDFKPYNPGLYIFDEPATNDWRKSAWKMELERIAVSQPYLLTDTELKEVTKWVKAEKTSKILPTTYDDTMKRVAKNAIKEMDYYGNN